MARWKSPLVLDSPAMRAVLADLSRHIALDDDAIRARLDAAEAELVSLDSRLDTAESTLTSHGTRLTTAESTLTSHGSRITTAENNITAIKGPPRCRLTRTSDQTGIASGAYTPITWQQEDQDTDNMWTAGSPDRVTFQTAGWYMIDLYFQLTTSGTGHRIAYIRNQSGGTIRSLSMSAVATTACLMQLSCAEYFAANDWIDCVPHHTAGVNLDVIRTASPPSPRLTVTRLSD